MTYEDKPRGQKWLKFGEVIAEYYPKLCCESQQNENFFDHVNMLLPEIQFNIRKSYLYTNY